MSKYLERMSKEAIERLKETINKGDTIFYIVKNVSNSGCYRHIDFYKFSIEDNRFTEGENRITALSLTTEMCKALGYPYKAKTGCMGVGGGGMDMGFHVIHQLSHALFDEGNWLKHSQL
tara:strand:- start:2711 stop:3067 length:357 start_codon:yes stop_codon:yes gene_type:complete